ncbi:MULTISPECIES: RES family NAD+ phosphorylase [Lonsdalea]|uniref:Uncharacterized protein n=2 Tax=Lonsdalea TaxID=1082702 RepID=A0ACD1J8H4_9GAMM|nr:MULTISPECIES: RES family NAD+ phosphorylase [Lonsdalea]RAT10780.1 hypothetical protein AU485_15830 [Lonsdalea quercina]RAT19080.1 hypothetical protein AU487_12530 [Lonsdalea populi]RAT20381.1 hypothetical protein AU489_16290 [Lonsdalea populi]RAT23494.1 hypothetical protein AU488_09660 [Lonsdalea populi]RAT32550.1 hypothetical protein AU492_12575 [Lonsdalea populi]
MNLQLEGDPHDRVVVIMNQEEQGKLQVTKVTQPPPVLYKVQDGLYDGNGVFFNLRSLNRFSLSDQSKGTIYLGDSPYTALKESFQGEEFIEPGDLERYYMAEIEISHPLKVIDLKLLAQHLNVSVADLMGPSMIYPQTQILATAMSKHVDGCEYLSRHTGDPCLVLWSDKTDGGGMLSTKSVTPLSCYQYKGKTAKQILEEKCNIRIM